MGPGFCEQLRNDLLNQKNLPIPFAHAAAPSPLDLGLGFRPKFRRARVRMSGPGMPASGHSSSSWRQSIRRFFTPVFRLDKL